MNSPDTVNNPAKPRQNIPMLREIIEERKTIAVETLSAGYARNRLPLEEYERLVEYINKIESERELAVVEKIVAEYSVENTGPEAGRPDRSSHDSNPQEFDDDDSYPDHGGSYSNFPVIFSSRASTGPVKSGSAFASIFGSQRIVIKKADLSRKQTFLDVVSIFGETTICVEQGIRVSNKVIPIMGSSDINNKVKRSMQYDAPELIISGAALFGCVTVKLLKD